jgi:GNAT superfamily N-acetyltransferase
MNDITISTVKNEGQIESLHGQYSFNYTYDEATISSLKKHFKLKDSLYLIAKNGPEFAAFCSIDRGWWEDNFFFLREILVDPQYRKLGLGNTLIKMCIEHAKGKMATGLVTETDFINYPMQNLCAKFGFKEWDNPQWKDGITYRLLF